MPEKVFLNGRNYEAVEGDIFLREEPTGQVTLHCYDEQSWVHVVTLFPQEVSHVTAELQLLGHSQGKQYYRLLS